MAHGTAIEVRPATLAAPSLAPASPGPVHHSIRAHRWAKLCFSCVLFAAFIGFSPVFLFGETDAATILTGGGDTVRQASFALTFLLVLSCAVATRGAAFLLRVPTALLIMLLWCWASAAWAIEPSTALRRAAFTSIVALSVLYSVRMLPYDTVISLLAGWFAAILLADWAVMPFFPLAAHQPGELDQALIGNWRGMHNHKNEAGAFCAIASLFFMHLMARSRSFLIGPALAMLSLGFLYMTTSKTSGGFVLVAAVIASLVEAGYRNPIIRRFLLLAAAIAVLALSVLAADRTELIAGVLDDPSSLTGRVQIWPVLLRYSADHLLLGSGYGSFWAIGASSPIYDGGPGWLTTITHAHNGYIDVLIQTGLIGLLIALAGLVLHPMYVLVMKPIGGGRSRWLICAILMFCWLHNLLETSLLDRANIVWVTMVIMLSLLLAPGRPPAPPRPSVAAAP